MFGVLYRHVRLLLKKIKSLNEAALGYFFNKRGKTTKAMQCSSPSVKRRNDSLRENPSHSTQVMIMSIDSLLPPCPPLPPVLLPCSVNTGPRGEVAL